MRVHRRRPDAEELLVPRVHAVRPDHTQVQLVVLRGLQVVQEAVRQQHSDIEELPADEGADVLLVVLGRHDDRRVRSRGHGGRLATRPAAAAVQVRCAVRPATVHRLLIPPRHVRRDRFVQRHRTIGQRDVQTMIVPPTVSLAQR